MKSKGIILALSIALIGLSSCKKEDSSQDTANATASSLQTGAWRVSYYDEDGDNHSSDFSGFVFTFQSGGSLSATNGSQSFNGSWSTGTDDSTPKLILNFNVSDGPFESISEDWRIRSNSATRIELQHVSGGNGGTDELIFVKN